MRGLCGEGGGLGKPDERERREEGLSFPLPSALALAFATGPYTRNLPLFPSLPPLSPSVSYSLAAASFFALRLETLSPPWTGSSVSLSFLPANAFGLLFFFLHRKGSRSYFPLEKERRSICVWEKQFSKERRSVVGSETLPPFLSRSLSFSFSPPM